MNYPSLPRVFATATVGADGALPVRPSDRLPELMLDVLAELYWNERDNDPAVEALRP